MKLKVLLTNPWAQAFLILTGLTASVFFVWWAGNILLPFIVAFILAYILDPAVDWMEETFGLKRMTSILIILVFTTVFLTVLGYYLTQEAIVFGQRVQETLQNPPDVREWFRQYTPESLREYAETVDADGQHTGFYERVKIILWQNLTKLASNLTEGTSFLALFVSRTMGMLNFLLNLIVVVFSTIYLLRDFDDIVLGIREEIPPRYRKRTDSISREINELMQAFLRGHLVICLIVGVLYGAGYLLVGLDGGFLIGFISGLLNFIPYVGSSVGFLFAFIMGVAQFGLSSWLFAVAGVFVVVQFFEGNILRPTVLGSAVGVNPVLVIFALMLFGQLMGFIGLLLAVPIIAVVKILLWHFREIYHRSDFYRNDATDG